MAWLTVDKSLLESAIAFHGHKCPAMPLGIRVGLAAMKALGVERASNKERWGFGWVWRR